MLQLQQALRCLLVLLCMTMTLLFYTILRINDDLSENKILGTRTLLMKPNDVAGFDSFETQVLVSSKLQRSSISMSTNSSGSSPHLGKCDVLQIAFFVEDFASVTKMTRSLKSLLFYRQSPIELHVILVKRNEAVVRTIETLFETWNLNSFRFKVHSTQHHLEGSSFPIHLVHTILPEKVNMVILLNVNTTFNSDIAELWEHFNKMRSSRKLFGVVKNTVDMSNISSCANKGHSTSFHYSTVAVLMDLQEIRKNRVLNTGLSVTVDNFQELMHKHHHLLPCKWGMQVNQCYNLAKSCDSYPHDIGILLVESLQKHVPGATDFMSYVFYLDRLWMQLDSRLLKSLQFQCMKHKKPKQQISTVALALSKFPIICHKILEASNVVYITHTYFIGHRYVTSNPYEVTLVTQLTADRLAVFFILLDQWRGPVSASVYCSDYDSLELTEQLKQYTEKRNNIAIHIVIKQGSLFPVNYLRNVALSASSTPYVFLSDCDFIPSCNLHSYLVKSAQALAGVKRAMVVPAFESLKHNFKIPTSKASLLEQCKKGAIQIFHKDWFSGHGPTNYNKWAASKYPYAVKWADYFEPYILVDRNVPKYAEQFLGYGYNKASHIMEVKASGYEFVVLPNGFVIHSPHMKTVERTAFVNDEGAVRSCIHNLKTEFVRSLHRKYGKNCLKNAPGKTKTYSNISTLAS